MEELLKLKNCHLAFFCCTKNKNCLCLIVYIYNVKYIPKFNFYFLKHQIKRFVSNSTKIIASGNRDSPSYFSPQTSISLYKYFFQFIVCKPLQCPALCPRASGIFYFVFYSHVTSAISVSRLFIKSLKK